MKPNQTQAIEELLQKQMPTKEITEQVLKMPLEWNKNITTIVTGKDIMGTFCINETWNKEKICIGKINIEWNL